MVISIIFNAAQIAWKENKIFDYFGFSIYSNCTVLKTLFWINCIYILPNL